MAIFKGTAGDDNLVGTSGNDRFVLTKGGNDTASGGDGNDSFFLGATLTAADRLDGGNGTDALDLKGDYSAGLVFGANTIVNIEKMNLYAGFDYDLTMNDGNVAAGQRLTVNAGGLKSINHLVFDGSAETDGSYVVTGGAGDDTLTGGALRDIFSLVKGGNDVAHGGGGNDTFEMGATLTAQDQIDGGAGIDLVTLDGNYSAGLILGATTMTNVEILRFTFGHIYSITTNDANVAAGTTLTVDGSALVAKNPFTFNGAAESDGSFDIIGGAGDDVLTGGNAGNTFDLTLGGHDTVTGGLGANIFNLGAAFDTGDRIDGAAGGGNTLIMNGAYSGLTVNGTMAANIQTLEIQGSNTLSLIWKATPALTLDASAAGGSLTFNFSTVSSALHFIGGALNTQITGGSGADTFDAGSGIDSFSGGAGNDTFNFGANFTAADSVDGGAGSNTLNLAGDYSAGLVFGAATMINVQTLTLLDGHSYTLTTNDATVASGQTLSVNAGALAANRHFVFNGGAETNGSFAVTGGAGADTITGGAQADTFDLTHGGNDVAHGGGGNDVFSLGAALTAADVIDGGTGSDTLSLNGDYSAGLVFGASTISNMETLQLAAGHNYSFTMNNANVASGQTLAVDASALGATDTLTVNGAAESDGSFAFVGGSGNDTLTGGAQADNFDLSHGGADIAHGGGGNDVFTAGAAFMASDSVDGGAGNDTLVLNGDYSAGLTFGAATMTTVETLQFAAGHNYNLTINDANVAAGQSLTVDGSALGASDALVLSGAAETDGSFAFIGGAGNDVLTGGALADTFDLSKGGADTAHGGGGNDVFNTGAALAAADTIDGGTGSDTLVLNGDYSGGVILGAATLTSIETLQFAAGHSYNVTTNDANVASGQTLTVDASALGAGDALVFSGAAETDAAFAFTGGSGSDTLTGGGGNDSFDLSHGGNDTVQGGAGNDTINAGGALTASDQIDGGSGIDTLVFNADYSAGLTLGATTVVNVETFQFSSGHSYALTTNDANVASGQVLTVDGSALGVSDALIVNGSAETNASFAFVDGAGTYTFTGGAQADTFDLTHSGNDTVHGGGGNDVFTMGAALTAADSIDGGTGADKLILNGDYSAGFTFGAATITNIETLQLAAGHSYNFTTNDANIASGQTLTVDGGALGASDTLTFNGAAETDGSLAFVGGAGGDTLTGGAQADTFDLSHGGTDTAHGGGGNDTFTPGAALTAADTIDGGTGSDTLALNGDYSSGFTFGATTIASIETIQLASGHSYVLTTNDGNVAAGGLLTIDGSGLGAGDALTVNGAAETDGSFAFVGGSGNDTLTGGAQADNFDLSHGGTDIAHGGGGNDVFSAGAAFTAGDGIDGGAGNDTLVLNGDYSAGLTFAASTIANVETIQLANGFSYNLSTDDANLLSGSTLAIDASTLSAGSAFTFDGSNETDGGFAVIGGAGNDTLTGGAQADTFDLTHGGNDTAHGGGGNDVFTMGAALTAADSIDGGAGADKLVLNGDYSAGFTFGAATISSVETLQFAAGHSYSFTTNDANIASGQTLTVDGSALGAGDALTFNGGAENNGSFAFVGGAGNDVLTGGNAGNAFDLTHGGTDTANGGLGVNVFNLGATLDSSDRINGALGATNTLILNGAYFSLAVSNSMVANIQTVDIQGSNTASIVWVQQAFSPMTVDASAAGGSLTFDFSAVNTSLHFIGGALNTHITGGSAADTFDAGVLTDIFSGNGGNDTFNFGPNFAPADQVDGGTGSDTLTLNGDFSAGFTFAATTMTNVETLRLVAGHDYNVATNDANVASGQTLTVDASGLGSANHLTFNGGAESDGFLSILGGAGADTVSFAANLAAGDHFDGGAGSDTLVLNGDYAGLTLGAATIVNVETVQLAAGHNYNLTTNDGNVAAGQTLTVDASALDASTALTFNGAAETNGSFAIIGGAGSDALTGGAQADTFDLSHGGTDTVHGGAGNDVINVGAALIVADQIDGGTGNDTLVLNGDYSGGFTFGNSTITAIETLQFAAGHSYNITANNVSFHGAMTLDAGALGAGDALVFNGAVAGATLAIIGGAGNDTLTGSGNNDTFDLSHGGTDTVQGNNGNDTISAGAALTAADTIDGGAGTDTLVLNGDYSAGLTLIDTTIANVETIQLAAGHSYNIATADANVASGLTLTVDASALGAGDTLVFNGSAEINGKFAIIGGAGDDVLTGNAQIGNFDLTHGGNDTVHGGTNFDQITMGATLTAADRIDGGGGNDTLSLNGDYSAGLVFGATTIANIGTITLAAGHDYNFTLNDATIAAGQRMAISATGLLSANHITLDATAETDGFLTVTGGKGSDTIVFAGNFVAGDAIDGGLTGSDTLVLNGDYAGLTFNATTVTDIATLRLSAGHSYNLTTNDGTVALATTMTVDASALLAADTLTFNGAAETNGFFHVAGGAGNDVVQMGAALVASDQFNGAGGNDTLVLNGDYAGLTLAAATITNVETLQLAAGHNYNLTTNDGNIAGGTVLTVDASALGAGNTAALNISAETDGGVVFQGGAGNDTITVGALVSASDQFNGGAGTDTLAFGTGGTIAIGANMLSSIETLSFAAGQNYHIALGDGNVVGGTTLTVNAGALASGNSIYFDASAETGGTYAFTGGAGNDTIVMGGELTASDTFNGGSGANILILNGDYSAGFTFGATTITNITTIQVLAGHSYNLTTNDANVGAGQELSIDASQLGAGDTFIFNASAEANAQLNINGGAGNDMITGGGGNDFIDVSQGGSDIVHGGGGNDTISLGAVLPGNDTIDGGAGSDQVNITGDYSAGFTFQAGMLTSVEKVDGFGNFSYNWTFADGVVAAGQTLTVSAPSLTFDGSAETDGFYAVTGGSTTDLFTMGAELKAQDSFNGSGGNDTLFLNGDYSTNLAFTAATITNIETLMLAGGHSYNFTLNNSNVASGQTLTVDASGLGASDVLTFNGATENNGTYDILAGAGNDVLTGGSFGNIFDLTHGGNDTAHGGAGADTFNLGATFTAADMLSGGGGADVLNLNGDYSAGVVFSATTVTTMATIALAAGHNYSLTTNDATVASGGHMTVDASALGAGDALTFNGAAETNGSFIILAGAGADTLTGGTGNDTFTYGANLSSADFVDGGAGSNTVNITGEYTGAAALGLGGGDFLNIESLILGAGHSYSITTDDTVVAPGVLMTIDGGTNNVTQLIFNGAAETDGAFNVIGGSGNDTITTGGGNDFIDISKGGNDTVSAGAGNDQITVLGAYTSADSIDGGAGSDLVEITSNLSGTLSNIFNVEYLQLTGSTINITFVDANVSAGATLTVDASLSANGVTLNGAAETDGAYDMIGTGHNDTLTGGAGNDTFDILAGVQGQNDTVHGGAGDDTINAGQTFSQASVIDGGTGNDTLVLAGNYTGNSLFATTLVGVEKIQCVGVSTDEYSFAFQDANVAAGATLVIDASTTMGRFLMNGAAETDGHYDFIAGSGFGNLAGGAQSDTFDMTRSGTWDTNGGGGDDVTYAGALFQTQATIFDTCNGAAGNDTLVFNGDYSAGITFVSGSLISVETLQFAQGFTYKFTTVDANVSAGATMTVDASALTTTALTFNGNAEHDGQFAFIGGAGNDVLTGGTGNDTFDLSHGGNDNAHGGTGVDTFYMGAAMTASDVINGGGGGDVLVLNGDYSAGLTISSSDVTNIVTIQLLAGHSYSLTFASTADAAVLDGSALGAGDAMTVDASALTGTGMDLIGGAGNDVLVGGTLSDHFDLSHGGTDTITGGGGADTIAAATAGNDTFVYTAVGNSTSAVYDTISNVDFGSDLFKVSTIGAVAGIDTAVTTGALSTATFDTNLAADIGAGQLAAHHAVLFTADSGTLAGHTFLIVDENGTVGYQAGADLVIEVTGAAGTLTTSDFI
jgi:Ca2+-binding RTX toxin-like protein